MYVSYPISIGGNCGREDNYYLMRCQYMHPRMCPNDFQLGWRRHRSPLHEETIRKINALEVCEAKKIRLKVVLALNKVKRDLYESSNFKDLPLEVMPYLLEMLQQRLSPTDFPRSLKTRGDATTLNRLYVSIKTWQTLPLLFARGPGKRKMKVAKKKPRKRRKFGDTEDDDDEAWIPKGARTTGKSWRNPVSGKWELIPPPVY